VLTDPDSNFFGDGNIGPTPFLSILLRILLVKFKMLPKTILTV
jgi:hypothetical protein